MGEPILELLAVGDIPEAPDSTDDLVVDALWLRYPFEHPAVLEHQNVVALSFEIGIDLLHLGHVFVRRCQLVADVGSYFPSIVPGEGRLRHSPHLNQPMVEADDLTFGIDHQNSVGSGVKRRGQQRQRLAYFKISPFTIGDIVTGHHIPADGRVTDEIDERQLEWEGPGVAVANQWQGDRHRTRHGCAS